MPIRPRIANTGTSYEPVRNDSGPRQGMSAVGIVRRIWITDACASVNESIAPNAYRLPRNAIAPGGIIRKIAITL